MLFEQAPVGRTFVALDGTIISANEPLAQMLGYSAPELSGRPMLEIVALADRAHADAEAMALLEGRASKFTTVGHLLHRDGREIPVRVFTTILRSADGTAQCWASVLTDASDLEIAQLQVQRAHAAALAAAERLRLLHSIATAANETSTLSEVASAALRTTCTCLGWPAGALLRWRQGSAAVQVAYGPTTWLADLDLPEPDTDGPTEFARAGHAVFVAPVSRTAGGVQALVFSCPDPDADMPRDMLTLIAGECSRVFERERAAKRLHDSEARFRAVFDASPFAMSITLGDTRTFYAVNDALCRLVGRTHDELIGSEIEVFLHPDDVERADAAGTAAATSPTGQHTCELRYVHTNGSVLVAEVTLTWVDGPDGGRVMLAQTVDITARRTAENALRAQSETDQLTGLANRFQLVRVLGEMGEDASGCAVLCINLDGFKVINDARGHDVGDEVLVEVAGRLHSVAGPDDLVARFGGDGFVLVCRTEGGGSMGGSHDPAEAARRMADRIESALTAPITTSSGRIHLSASIGIGEGTSTLTTPLDLLQRADAAMYQAKRLGKDRRVVYDTRLHRRAIEHRRIESALRNALDEHRFVVHYQPIVALADSRITGFEALVRLLDEAGNIVPPDEFIGVAEQSGLIVPMGTWVLTESCRCIAELSRQLDRPLSISVNVAARQAARADLTDVVTAALAAADLPPTALTLELTESALLDADDETMGQLNGLRERGVLIGLDDFGTGYSSLTYLRQLPVSHLKVDRSFVSDMIADRGNAAIVRAVTRLADDLGLFWVAEGVETPEQHRALAQLGPGFAQGYLYSRAVPADALPDLLAFPAPEPVRSLP